MVLIDYFATIPDEILIKIFRYLQYDNRVNPQLSSNCNSPLQCLHSIVPRVCRRWHNLARDRHLWTSLTLDAYHLSQTQLMSILLTKPNLRALRLQFGSVEFSLGHVSATCPGLDCLYMEQIMFDNFDVILPSVTSSIQHVTLRGLSAFLCGLDSIYDAHIQSLCQNLPNIRSMVVRDCWLSNVAVNHIAENTTALQVFITDMDSISDGVTLKILDHHWEFLQQIELNCFQVTDSGFVGIAKCRGLVKLRLLRCEMLTDKLLAQLSELPRLTFLSLNSGRGFSETGWECFANRLLTHSRGLKAFDVDGQGITDRVLAKLVAVCPRLYFIRLSRCSLVTDRGIELVVDSCPEMKQCYLHYLSSAITRTPFVNMPGKMSKLDCLDLVNCRGISDRDRDYLASLRIPFYNRSRVYENPFDNILCKHFIG